MLLGGLWHGAAWSYMVWGGVHGLALAVERLFSDIRGRSGKGRFAFLKIGFVFLYVTFAWLLFKLPNFNHVIGFVQNIGSNFFLKDNTSIITFTLIYSFPVFLYHLFYLKRSSPWMMRVRKSEHLVYGCLLFLILMNSGSPGTFIYFQF
jgi:alginate O-acetyltransferase complex protein AlgI